MGLEIKNRLKDKNVSLSLPSQRVDAFDENIAHIIANAGKRSGLTFAPEAGTQRMRDVINKGLTNEDLLRGVKTAWDQGWRQVKLYFMIGLPGETDADVLGIAETIEWLQRECRQGKWHLAVNVTISNFTPKPHTPFQWHSVSREEFLRKQTMLREAMRKLHQVKANFTPVDISAMEDFVARGDRRIAAVIKRAWELGATNDAWWQSTADAHAAWSQAIEDTGMSWKYRQVDTGEWDVMEHSGDARYRGQGGGGKGRVDRGSLADERLDAPLPWDHVDTGIAKWWLKADLQRALEAATVPDCSHSGLCSECGVCGDEFGDNVVFEPPPVPQFKGHYRPDSTKAQRLRFRFAKRGDMVFVGHLDMMTVWDRAFRRASLPVTADQSPFAVRQRIYAALPLPLGATSSSEVLEVYFTEKKDATGVRAALQAELPTGLQLLSVEEVEVYKRDGSNGEKMSQLLESVEYYVGVLAVSSAGETESIGEEESSAKGTEGAIDVAMLQRAVASILDAPELPVERANKKNKKTRVTLMDMRPALMELEVCHVAPGSMAATLPLPANATVLRFRTGCANGNPILTPGVLLSLLGKAAGEEYAVAHLHRSDIRLKEASVPRPDWLKLRSLVRMEGHLAAARQFSNSGPWAGGLEVRTEVS